MAERLNAVSLAEQKRNRIVAYLSDEERGYLDFLLNQYQVPVSNLIRNLIRKEASRFNRVVNN